MLQMKIVGLAVVLGSLQLMGAPHHQLSLGRIQEFESQRQGWLPALDADSSHSYDMVELHLNYRVEDGPEPATGTAALTIVGVVSQNIIPFNAELLSVSAVTENGYALPFFVQNDTVYVERPLAAGDTATIEFTVSVPIVFSNSQVGYHHTWQHVFTFSEPYGARRWFPCFDQPFDKFNRVDIAVNMPSHWSLASNGLLVETTFPEPGRKRERYIHESPVSTYLVMICAGLYTKRFETVDGVLYRYYAFPEDSLEAIYDWERTPQMTALFNTQFGPYPYNEYGMVQAALFNGWGAMEHQTFTTYGTNLVDGIRTFEPIVAHELAHQWFGDALGPVDFRNMWLNEGFATYASALWTESVDGQAVFRQVMAGMAQAYYNEDSFFRYAPYDPPPQFLFGNVIYQKSAYILHMLREQLLGDSLFFAAVRAYVSAHLHGTVDTEDLIASVNGAANQDLRWFFDQWIYQAGHPELQVSIAAGYPEAHDVTVTVQQVQSNAPIYRIPILVDVQTVEGTLTRQFWVQEQVQTVTQSFAAPIVSAVQSAYQPLLFQQTGMQVPSYPPGTAVRFELETPYPNPFNSATRIPFELSHTAHVSIDIHGIDGRHVGRIAAGNFGSGRHELTYHADPHMASGVYFVIVQAAGRREFRKLVLLK